MVDQSDLLVPGAKYLKSHRPSAPDMYRLSIYSKHTTSSSIPMEYMCWSHNACMVDQNVETAISKSHRTNVSQVLKWQQPLI
jgi:NADH:ubiquinone oxidoreductase subunit